MVKRKDVKAGDRVVWFGYGKTGDGSASWSLPPNTNSSYAFEVKCVNSNGELVLKDEYNGVSIHRNQVLKVYRRKPKPTEFFLKRTCTNPVHGFTIQTKYQVMLGNVPKEVWGLCDQCDFATVKNEH